MNRAQLITLTILAAVVIAGTIAYGFLRLYAV
jgi:hypothetical protein